MPTFFPSQVRPKSASFFLFLLFPFLETEKKINPSVCFSLQRLEKYAGDWLSWCLQFLRLWVVVRGTQVIQCVFLLSSCRGLRVSFGYWDETHSKLFSFNPVTGHWFPFVYRMNCCYRYIYLFSHCFLSVSL